MKNFLVEDGRRSRSGPEVGQHVADPAERSGDPRQRHRVPHLKRGLPLPLRIAVGQAGDPGRRRPGAGTGLAA